MAIVFSKDISSTVWLNAYNNNVVTFNSDSIKTAMKCTITIGGNAIEITPNPSGVFKYNLKELLKALINNNFIDSVAQTSTSVGDGSLAKTYTVTFLITFSDTTTETTNKTIYVIKRVEQIGKGTSYLVANSTLLNDTNVVIWNDLPFDLTVLGLSNFTIDVNSNTSSVVPTQLATRVLLGNYDPYRRLLNAGYTIERNECIDSNLTDPIPYGYSTIRVGGNIINVEKRSDCGVQYLKWFNVEKGYYAYWGFNSIYKDNLSVKTRDTFNVDYENLSETYNTELTSGKGADLTRNLITENLNNDNRDLLNSLFTSPKVELYQDGIFQSVVLLDGTFQTENTKVITHKLNISIRLNHYTL